MVPEYCALLIFGTFKLTSLKTGIRMQDIFSKGIVGLQPSMNGKIMGEFDRQSTAHDKNLHAYRYLVYTKTNNKDNFSPQLVKVSSSSCKRFASTCQSFGI